RVYCACTACGRVIAPDAAAARAAGLAAGQGGRPVWRAPAAVGAHHRVPLRRHRLVLAAAYGHVGVCHALAPFPSRRPASRSPVPGTAEAGRGAADVLQGLRAIGPATVRARGAGGRLRPAVRHDPRAARHGDFRALFPDRAAGGETVLPRGPDRLAAHRRELCVLPGGGRGHARAGADPDGPGALQGRGAGRRGEMRALGPARRQAGACGPGAGGDPGPARQPLLLGGAAKIALRAHGQGPVDELPRRVRHARTQALTDRSGAMNTSMPPVPGSMPSLTPQMATAPAAGTPAPRSLADLMSDGFYLLLLIKRGQLPSSAEAFVQAVQRFL